LARHSLQAVSAHASFVGSSPVVPQNDKNGFLRMTVGWSDGGGFCSDCHVVALLAMTMRETDSSLRSE
ncbi:MAG: hypothetical protein K2N02_01475, partial [Alistipes sp.]|nr:hypothetical protein [Alistipes sp.]